MGWRERGMDDDVLGLGLDDDEDDVEADDARVM